MLFSIGVELPKNENECYGLVVPALCTDIYSCFSAADTDAEILPQVRDVIESVLTDMLANDVDIATIKDKGFSTYRQEEDFAYCDTWLLIDVDISDYMGKKQRVNISVPDYMLRRIDQSVSSNPRYKDRSHFLMVAAERELANL